MLSRDWNLRKPSYDFIVIGSGYGGAITAARIAGANLNPKPSICILERGKEWAVGSFPDTLEGYLGNLRRDGNPLGLYEMINYRDISVIKGSGLGGTSLVNANVAIVPDEAIFRDIDGWPKDLTLGELLPFYQTARDTLAATPHPRFAQLPKIQALDRRATQMGLKTEPLKIAVNFTIDGPNAHGVPQKPCTDCGDCVTGCNVGAKNTLYMNYLPMAANSGAEIYTQTKVESIEKLPGGGWRVNGIYQKTNSSSKKFTLDARNVILSAGAINSTEILLRSAHLKDLPVSPALGTRFGGNGDFFGISYNGDARTQVLGFGNHPASPGALMPPGPSIVGIIRYAGNAPVGRRFTIEDLSFPGAFVRGAQLAFAALRGEDTDAGDETAERERSTRDFFQLEPYHPDGALNHSMLYLCMGIDDSGGYFKWERPFFERDGRVSVEWGGAGRQPIFGTINEELRRHARANGGSFLANPLWAFLNVGHLVTAHPLGGCPMGDNYIEGAVDQFGRVYSSDGSVHDGLYVADGSIIPSALGVNPFLTISALSERIAARKIRQLQGDAYPATEIHAGFDILDPVDVSTRSETELERIFDCAVTQPLEVMVNNGGRVPDPVGHRIRNDEYWKGFFPKGNILNQMSAAIYTGFKKKFSKKGSKFIGLTSDTDGRINANNSLEIVEIKETTGDLKPGKYILLKYLDPPWQGFYDIFKLVNKDLLIGRVYLGNYPNGQRMFTFPMTRVYSYDQMTVADHRELFAGAAVPTGQDLQGVWRMDVISNANSSSGMAYLAFDNKPDGRLESRYQLMGLIEGLVVPTSLPDHFQLNDFTAFHDEIRMLEPDLMIGKWVTNLPMAVTETSASTSLGIFHWEPDQKKNTNLFGFYYLLRRSDSPKLPRTTLLSSLLDAQLPRGVGMTFDETMDGSYTPNGGVETTCQFTVRMTIADLNDFIDGPEHEARLSGTIDFGDFAGAPAHFTIDPFTSFFNYLRVNPATGEAEMRYYLEFDADGKRHTLEGRKFMQHDVGGGVRGPQEVLDDYTTLFITLHDDASELGKGILKFRTFENLFAIGNLAGFLRSFRVTGTPDLSIQLMGQMRFLAFTGQFVQSEYDPMALPVGG